MNPYVKIEEFYSMSGEKKCHFKIVPVRGTWLTFENDSMENLFVSLTASRRIPFSLFLNVFEEKNENDPIYFLKFLEPGESYDVESAKEKVHSLFFNEESYALSECVRAQLNGILHNGKEEKPKENVLTKEDLLAIRDFFKSGFFESEFEIEPMPQIKHPQKEEYLLEKELLWLEIELDKYLEALYYTKDEKEKKEILLVLKQNRKRYNEIYPS